MTNADYMNLAIEKGTEVGKFVATLKTNHIQDANTFHKAAVAFVNSLPLNDINFETALQIAFENAAQDGK